MSVSPLVLKTVREKSLISKGMFSTDFVKRAMLKICEVLKKSEFLYASITSKNGLPLQKALYVKISMTQVVESSQMEAGARIILAERVASELRFARKTNIFQSIYSNKEMIEFTSPLSSSLKLSEELERFSQNVENYDINFRLDVASIKILKESDSKKTIIFLLLICALTHDL